MIYFQVEFGFSCPLVFLSPVVLCSLQFCLINIKKMKPNVVLNLIDNNFDDLHRNKPSFNIWEQRRVIHEMINVYYEFRGLIQQSCIMSKQLFNNSTFQYFSCIDIYFIHSCIWKTIFDEPKHLIFTRSY